MDAVSFYAFGDLSPELEEMLKANNTKFFRPVRGSGNRTIASTDKPNEKGMVFIISNITVKSGQEANHRRITDYHEERMGNNEPNYTYGTYSQSDTPGLIAIEMFSDVAAFNLHMEEHQRDPEPFHEMQGIIESLAPPTMYGNVTTEVEEMLKPHGVNILKPTFFTTHRTIVPKSD